HSLGGTEGYYLLLSRGGPATAPRVFRVEVTDVAKGPVLTLRASPDAARLLKWGDGVELLRPPLATTAQLRALPAVIPFVDEADPNAAAAARQKAFKVRSINNLKQIGLALHNFNVAHGQFPPAVIFGPDGKPWHSWRVLILPFVEQNALYDAYDFTQPWNSEKNLKLLDRMPEVYRDPVRGDEKGHFTHYAALVGPATLFKPAGAKQTDPKNVPLDQGGTRSAEITDGTSNTMMVAPVDAARKIAWTQPEDVAVGPKFPGLAGLGEPGSIGTPYTVDGLPGSKGAAPVLFADGSVFTLSAAVSPRVIHALTTINGLDYVGPDAYAPRNTLPTLKVRIDGPRAIASIE
ncbi:MAG: DUF1559 domain-containing protein, partial [Isosphaeraceae bacterium]